MIEIKRSVKQISCTERVRAPNTRNARRRIIPLDSSSVQEWRHQFSPGCTTSL